jgi:hypothetical protein
MNIGNMKYAKLKSLARIMMWRRSHSDEAVALELEEVNDCTRPSSEAERHNEELEEAIIVGAVDKEVKRFGGGIHRA